MVPQPEEYFGNKKQVLSWWGRRRAACLHVAMQDLTLAVYAVYICNNDNMNILD